MESERLHYLDNLRALAILLLVPFHSAIIYCSPGPLTYIKDPAANSAFLNYFSTFVALWFMPLLFFIAGGSVALSLSKRTVRQFVLERLSKLALPLGFGTLCIVSILSYFRAISRMNYTGSFIQFIPDFFNGIFPYGNFEWGHLWFLAYLFVFSMILLPAFAALSKPSSKGFLDKVANIANFPVMLFIPGILIGVSEAFLRPSWPGMQNLVADWANFTQYLILFFCGYLYLAHPRIADAVSSRSLLFGIVSGVVIIGILTLNILGLRPAWGMNPASMLYLGACGFFTYVFVLFLIGISRLFWNRTSLLKDYIRESIFPFYILHYLPVTIVGFVFLWIPLPAELEWILLTAIAGAITFGLIELVKKANWLRFLFGMKQKK